MITIKKNIEIKTNIEYIKQLEIIKYNTYDIRLLALYNNQKNYLK
jgi:hypothetical protein